MYKILYVLFLTLLSGCTLPIPYSEYPMYNSYSDGFVRMLKINSSIIDVEKEQINTKEELLAYFDANNNRNTDLYNFNDRFLWISITGEIDASIYEYVVYIKPLCKNKPVLNTNLYASGMPISINFQKREFGSHSYYITSYDGRIYQSNQQVVLVKGNPEYWVDPSYEYYGEKFVILPVCDNLENDMSELRFTYTVEKVQKN
ncbi:MAG: hypothetical protein FWF51_10150 [Chitinivibrionia bacterium]|nr:hypothetical protein [Chitinivibrionia bacterium]MCL1947490.1 hypothetical protein [Chitinivibrionia bacterium]